MEVRKAIKEGNDSVCIRMYGFDIATLKSVYMEPLTKYLKNKGFTVEYISRDLDGNFSDPDYADFKYIDRNIIIKW